MDQLPSIGRLPSLGLPSSAALPSLADLVELSGRRALVTGGSKGIGAAIAARLSQAGAIVTITDVDEPDGDSIVASPQVPAITFVRGDVTSAADCKRGLDAACGRGGNLDILVNNAGIFPTTGPVQQVADDFIARLLDVNVRAQYSLTREAAKRMPNGGAVINLASILALRGGANLSVYALTKAAIVGMTRAFANELGPQGIRVNAIAPGVIDTPGVQRQMVPLKQAGVDIESIKTSNPLRISGQPDHIARAALFLASDLAAFVNGHVLVVDGGSTA